MLVGLARAVVDRGELRHADAGDHAGGADGAGADAHLDRVHARVDQRAGAPRRWRRSRPPARSPCSACGCRATTFSTPRLWPCAVSTTIMSTPARARASDAHLAIRAHADCRGARGAAPWSPWPRPGGGAVFSMSLRVMRPRSIAVGVDHRQLLDAVLVQEGQRLVGLHALARGDQLAGHHRVHPAGGVALEADVAVGDHADQAGAVDHRDAADVVAAHQLQRVLDGLAGGDGDRLHDHPALELLDPGDLERLLLGRHVLVHHPDAAGLGHGDGRAGLGDRVHGCGQQGDVQAEVARQPRAELGVAGEDGTLGRLEEDVIEGERQADGGGQHGAHSYAAPSAADNAAFQLASPPLLPWNRAILPSAPMALRGSSGTVADQGQGPVGLAVKLPFATTEELLARYGQNLTRGGVYLRSKTTRPLGTPVTLELRLAGGERVLWASAVVHFVTGQEGQGLPGHGAPLPAGRRADPALPRGAGGLPSVPRWTRPLHFRPVWARPDMRRPAGRRTLARPGPPPRHRPAARPPALPPPCRPSASRRRLRPPPVSPPAVPRPPRCWPPRAAAAGRGERQVPRGQPLQRAADPRAAFEPATEEPARTGPIIGIDLGTSNSCSALVRDGKPAVLQSREGYNTVPSILALNARGKLVVGHPAKSQMLTNPRLTVYGSKRLVGRAYDSALVQEFKDRFHYEIAPGAERRGGGEAGRPGLLAAADRRDGAARGARVRPEPARPGGRAAR